jgi:hypothetical protein
MSSVMNSSEDCSQKMCFTYHFVILKPGLIGAVEKQKKNKKNWWEELAERKSKKKKTYGKN